MRSVIVAAAVFATIGCAAEGRPTALQNPGGDDPGIPVVATVEISPTPATLRIGKTMQLSATARDASGAVISGRTVTWTTVDQAVATVNTSGLLNGVTVGATTARATVDDKFATTPVTVTLASVATVAITPLSAPINAGNSTQLVVTLRDADAVVLTGRSVTWSSSNQSVATVGSSGMLNALAPGSTTITATSEGVQGTISVTVNPAPVAAVQVSPNAATLQAGNTQQLSAVTIDAHNTVLTGRTVTWASSNTAVARVSTSGLVTAVAVGSAIITATSEGINGTSSFTVTAVPPVPVASVALSLAAGSLTVGQSAQGTATLRDASSNVLTGRAVTWASSNTAVATVASSGLVTARGVGTAVITATSEGVNGTASITVTAVPVASVSVAPASSSIAVGATQQLTATTRDASNNVLTGRTITWSSSNTGVATVSAAGLVTAVAAGTATITATSEGVNGTSSVTVTVPVATVAVSLSASTLTTGQTTQATATLRDANNNVLTGRAVTWASANTAIATVSASGVVTAVAPGSAAIRATSEGRTGSATLTVTAPTPAPVASVNLTPAAPSVQAGQTQALTATLRDASSNVLTGRTVTWVSGNPSVATVSSAGVVTGVTAGTSTITATSEGVNGTAAVTVTAAPPPPLPNGQADPTQLPRATGQNPVAGTYGRSLAAGRTYVDPNTNVTVLKLTDAVTPTANSGMYHGYSEGGPNISQPWTGTDGQVYYTAKTNGWLVDIRYSTMATSNWRRVPYWGEIGFAFSMDPATPRIAYVSNGSRVDRYNTESNRVENIGNWPWIPTAAGQYLEWLQVQMNDKWLVGMFNSNHTVIAFRPSDGMQRTITEAAANVVMDEPHLDREFPYIYLSTSSNPPNKIVNLETMAYTNPRDPNGLNGDDHAAPLRGKIVALVYMVPGIVAVDYTGNTWGAVAPSPTDWSGDWHMAGQWVFNNPSEYFVIDQWQGHGNYPIKYGMIGMVSMSGDVRLVVASDAIGGGYGTGGQGMPTLAPDGKLMMWTANMNQSGRYDTFIARLPVK